MTPAERYARIKQVYLSALEYPPDAQAAYLFEECGDDRDLMGEVERMLVAGRSATRRIEGALGGVGEPVEERPFPGTGRYPVPTLLGRGEFGEVYRVYDTWRRVPLAVKVLIDAGPEMPDRLHRFKKEFRGLVDIGHRNLVALHELQSEGKYWFFTMEYVEGKNFYEYAVPNGPDYDLLRPAMAELAAGVDALHRNRKAHCDLKPENVLVEPGGRVVILDYGLATDLPDAESDGFGTPRYMSPEQAKGQLLSEASDWYSVGVMLYECLTGSRLEIPPYERDPRPVSEVRPDAPADLSGLCMELLRRDATLRPSAADILGRLPAVPDDGQDGIDPLGEVSPLIGRDSELRALREAFDEAAGGRPTAVLMHGRSGVGKSVLARQFLDEARERGLVLAGRCYERESVPYKALDNVVDKLSGWLGDLPRDERKKVLPADFEELATVFDTLQIPGWTRQAEETMAQKADRRNERQRVFQALSDLLAAAAARKPLVLAIDDLQWGDADSAALLEHLLSRGEPLSILFLFIYRSDEAQSSPLLKRLLGKDSPVRRIDLPVRELEDTWARELAWELLGRDSSESHEAAEALVASIAKVSGGNPFLIGELVRFLRSAGTTALPALPALLEDLIQLRVKQLPEGCRRLLEVVALASQPIALDIAAPACELKTGAYKEVARLRRSRMIRVRYTEESEELETYHDRIREKIEGSLTQEASQQYHLRLAKAGESSGRAQPRFLAEHFRAGGSDQPAYHYAMQAAEKAEGVYAYEDAADCYRLASKSSYEYSREHVWARLKLSIALHNAGRTYEGAEIYAGLTATEQDPFVRAELDHILKFELDYIDRTVLAEFSHISTPPGWGEPGESG